LCRDDGADDVDVVGGSEPLDGGVEDPAGIWSGSVVYDDTGAPGALKMRSSVSR